MSTSRKNMFFIAFSFSALALAGCGGDDPAPAVPAAGNCQAGFVYSPQYGCMNQAGCQPGTAKNPQGQCVTVSTATTSCQQTNQGPMVYGGPQYGCLPQGNCGVGMGAYLNPSNNTTSCVPAQMGGTGYGQYGQMNSCPIGQTMTKYGCLPEGVYGCGIGFGYLNNQCYPTVVSKSRTGIDTDLDTDIETYDDDYSTSPITRTVYVRTCAPKKIKVNHRRVKIKYPRHCR